MNYCTSAEICKLLKISPVTLMNWKNKGKIQYKKLSDKKYLYDVDSVMQENSNLVNRINVIYARVSTSKQKEDLDKQIETIKNYMLNNGVHPDEIYSDIDSGMNEQRKSFNDLLIKVFKGEVQNVYIAFKDRLSRFGFQYFKQIFEYFGTSIVILDSNEETNKIYQQELTEDLIDLIHSYSMKLYNNKKQKLKQIANLLENDIDK